MSAKERQIPALTREPVDAVLGIGMYARPEMTDELANQRLSIGAFSRRSRLSLKALRLYERLGVLTPARVDPGNGYRWYLESQLATARLIGVLRRLDMPLAQVGEVLSVGGPQAADLITSYWDTVEQRVASQRELAAHLRLRLLGQQRSFDMFAIQERDVPEQLVLTEQRHVNAKELQAFIGAATDRLMQSAAQHGGVNGSAFIIYHGEVNEDSDGPVEICVPIDLAQEKSVRAAARREPAHHEAYTRLRKAQVQYPQILSAFDAVSDWISRGGHSNAGSPREVYFTGLHGSQPERRGMRRGVSNLIAAHCAGLESMTPGLHAAAVAFAEPIDIDHASQRLAAGAVETTAGSRFGGVPRRCKAGPCADLAARS